MFIHVVQYIRVFFFFACHKIGENGEMCNFFFICASHFCDLKIVLQQTIRIKFLRFEYFARYRDKKKKKRKLDHCKITGYTVVCAPLCQKTGFMNKFNLH